MIGYVGELVEYETVEERSCREMNCWDICQTPLQSSHAEKCLCRTNPHLPVQYEGTIWGNINLCIVFLNKFHIS